jgi:hypothetical protein
MNKKTSIYSAEIKTEILQICEAFSLGSFLGLLSFTPSSKVEGYIFTQFETTLGSYNHYYRAKNN